MFTQPSSTLPHLPLAVFELEFRCGAVDALPGFAGSAWRGAFGRALKKTVCVVRDSECPACPLYRSCVYPYIFETPPPLDTEKMRRYTAAPHPFVLQIHQDQHGADHYRLGLVLVGRADRYLPYIICAMERAGKCGLGRERHPFDLLEVRQAAVPGGDEFRTVYGGSRALSMQPAEIPEIPAVPDWFEVEIETPLRLRRDDRLVAVRDFRFGDLFRSLLRRISMLTYFHTDFPLEADFAVLSRGSREIPIYESELSWCDWTRYSSRQMSSMQMGGLVGRFRVAGEAVEPYWPYLWLGQWTHAGKGATMGLGCFRIRPSNPPERF